MKVVFDTDVVLDLLLDREPFSVAATELFARVERGDVTGMVSATTVTRVYYLAQKARGRGGAHEAISRLLGLVDVAQVGRPALEAALVGTMTDFEDAVVCAAALSAGADAVVTRNLTDFTKAPLPVHAPDALLTLLEAIAGD
jgi:predicted nucleic acid-binding protein